MKKIIRKFINLFGIDIVRAKSSRKYLPKPCVENVELIVKFYQLMKKPISILQVGACDGVTSDSIYSYIKQGTIQAFLVEPSRVNFEKLKTFYQGQSNTTLINMAVADKDERRPFYTIKDEGRWRDNGWARQLASFYKRHLIEHGINEDEIAMEEVECGQLSTIVNTYNIQELDILLIDTEGYDGEVVKMALRQGVTPNFIIFENAQLVKLYTQHELDSLYSTLNDAGYVWTHDRINTMAIKRTFFSDERSSDARTR
jgi:FkbM family methyltransferase